MHYIQLAMQAKEPMQAWCSWHALWGDPNYHDPKMTHKWGYTKQMVHDLLATAGFTHMQMAPPRYHFPMRDMRVTAIKEF